MYDSVSDGGWEMCVEPLFLYVAILGDYAFMHAGPSWDTVLSELQLKIFVTTTLDQPDNITLVYFKGENVSTVWPSKCSASYPDVHSLFLQD